MEIVDSQIHRPTSSMPARLDSSGDRLEFEVELSITAMDAVGVDAAIVLSDREFCEAAATAYPERLTGVVHYSEPLSIQAPDAELLDLRSRPGIRGLRLAPGWPLAGENLWQLRDGALDPIFAAAGRHELALCIFAPQALPDLHRVARLFPDTRIIIDHLGMLPPPRLPLTPDLLDPLPELLELARYPNVAVKFSAAPALSLERYPYRDIWRRAGLAMIEAFSPGRLMWGSDYTRMEGMCTYAELLGFLRDSNEVSESDKVTMFASATRAWFHWPRESSLPVEDTSS